VKRERQGETWWSTKVKESEEKHYLILEFKKYKGDVNTNEEWKHNRTHGKVGNEKKKGGQSVEGDGAQIAVHCLFDFGGTKG
jgi:hypothetical protein